MAINTSEITQFETLATVPQMRFAEIEVADQMLDFAMQPPAARPPVRVPGMASEIQG